MTDPFVWNFKLSYSKDAGGLSESHLPFQMQKSLQTGYFAQQTGAGTNIIKLISWYYFPIYAFQVEDKKTTQKHIIQMSFPANLTVKTTYKSACRKPQRVVPSNSMGAYAQNFARVAWPQSYLGHEKYDSQDHMIPCII